MSYIFSHAFIPLAILFIFSNKLNINPKNIIIFSIFGIFPDFDTIFIHRMTFHNIFILIIPLSIFIFTKKKEIVFIVSFYLLSHLILDLFNGGIYVLYPIFDGKFFINAEIMSNYNIDGIMYTLNYGIKGNFINNVAKSGHGYGIVSSENVGIAILLLIMILISFVKTRVKR